MAESQIRDRVVIAAGPAGETSARIDSFPFLGRLVREFDVLPNIRRANIEDEVGWIVCELAGEPASVEKALSWLVDAGVAVDRLGDVVES